MGKREISLTNWGGRRFMVVGEKKETSPVSGLPAMKWGRESIGNYGKGSGGERRRQREGSV